MGEFNYFFNKFIVTKYVIRAIIVGNCMIFPTPSYLCCYNTNLFSLNDSIFHKILLFLSR